MNEFNGQLRPRITGVTRVSRRVIFLVLFVVAGVMFGLVYGMNTHQARAADPDAQPATLAQVPSDDNNRFGSDAPTNLDSSYSALVKATRVSVPSFSTRSYHNVNDIPPHVLPALAMQNQRSSFSQPGLDDAIDLTTQGRVQVAQAAFSQASQVIAAATPAPTQSERPQDSPLLVEPPQSREPAPMMLPQQSAPVPSQSSQQQPTPAPSATSFLSGPFNEIKQVQGALSDAYHDAQYVPSQRYAPRTNFELIAGSVLPAELVTAIDSELPGVIVAQVRSDVFDSRSGRYLLVPRGSRLVGVYQSEIGYGQSRVLVAWQRLIFPDTSSIDLYNQPGADSDGRAGLSGAVDRHTGRIIGALLVSSILSAASGLQANIGTANSSNGSIIVNSAGQQVAQAGTQLAEKEANVPPTIHIPKGYPFVVVVDRDIAFSQPYVAQR